MALTNFILTVVGVSAVFLLMRSDVKQSASIFKRNVRQIRHWLEEESVSAAKLVVYACLAKTFRTVRAKEHLLKSCLALFQRKMGNGKGKAKGDTEEGHPQGGQAVDVTRVEFLIRSCAISHLVFGILVRKIFYTDYRFVAPRVVATIWLPRL
ncbi:hypothetical protein R3W88_007228 [Solanum pinnatisectum]|uniref:Uncharacterized protein n=1 Tax=Solanum pinnatisectum TaxID=50273 RepID=A0AAV9KJX2_9SOLN|nr:hypothetical protein R3W88_007228 [Solanum pinnatisectum]